MPARRGGRGRLALLLLLAAVAVEAPSGGGGGPAPSAAGSHQRRLQQGGGCIPLYDWPADQACPFINWELSCCEVAASPSPPPPAASGEVAASPSPPPPAASGPPPAASVPTLSFTVHTADANSLLISMPVDGALALVDAVGQAAMGLGAQRPLVTVQAAGNPARRLAQDAVSLLVTAAFAAGDAAAAQQLGQDLLQQPEAVLPPDRFGQVTVADVQYTAGSTILSPPPPLEQQLSPAPPVPLPQPPSPPPQPSQPPRWEPRSLHRDA